MNKFIEKEEKKYVIATLDHPTLYLKKTPAKSEYIFTTDISIATKAASMHVAEQIKNYYYCDTGANIDLVVIPVMITFELIDEAN